MAELGRTLYHFGKDRRNSGKSACYGRCAKVWPPYTTIGRPRAEILAHESLVGTIKRRDGTTQVTYAGWPLYYYAHDGPVTFKGLGIRSFGGTWYLLTPDGQKIGH